jgi:nickel-dependent lactate racemase
MSRNSRDSKGNELGVVSQAMRKVNTLARSWDIFERQLDRDILVQFVNIKLATYEGGEHLVILKGVSGTTKVVAFHSAEDLLDALAGALARIENDTLKWREDTPWQGGQ